MDKSTLATLRTTIEQAPALDEARKQTMLRLVEDLAVELAKASDPSTGKTIEGLALAGTTQATSPAGNPAVVELAIEALGLSVRRAEASHPALTSVVNAFCTALANMGI